MDSLIGLPTQFFADEELVWATVRLLLPWQLGEGDCLAKGECFKVMGTVWRGDGLNDEPIYRRRWLELRNRRALSVPVEADCCELIFKWPQSAERKNDGR